MWRLRSSSCLFTVCAWLVVEPAFAQERSSSAKDEPADSRSAQESESDAPAVVYDPALPEGMTLDEVLDDAAQPPPSHFPHPVPDDAFRAFALFEQLELRARDGGRDQLGWETQGWMGYDYDRFWWKTEGAPELDGADAGESETDLLYSRLITPFWFAQFGLQYANAWESGEYSDRWSGVVAVQGVAPGRFEVDSSLYVSEDADVTVELEAEYNVRITQRLVVQPRTELGFAFQDIPKRRLGAGMTDVRLDLRVRYEIRREIAPYIGLRHRFLTGETADLAEAVGRDTDGLFFLAGVRLAF